MPLHEKLLPEYLRNLGYSTHMVGKWHLGFYTKEYTPLYRGFDSHIGFWSGHHDYFDHSAVEEVRDYNKSLANVRRAPTREKIPFNPAAVLGIGHEERIGASLGPPRPIFDGHLHEGGCETDRQSQHQSSDVPLLVPRRSPFRKFLQPSACTRP